jgi:hypothetical protein
MGLFKKKAGGVNSLPMHYSDAVIDSIDKDDRSMKNYNQKYSSEKVQGQLIGAAFQMGIIIDPRTKEESIQLIPLLQSRLGTGLEPAYSYGHAWSLEEYIRLSMLQKRAPETIEKRAMEVAEIIREIQFALNVKLGDDPDILFFSPSWIDQQHGVMNDKLKEYYYSQTTPKQREEWRSHTIAQYNKVFKQQ